MRMMSIPAAVHMVERDVADLRLHERSAGHQADVRGQAGHAGGVVRPARQPASVAFSLPEEHRSHTAADGADAPEHRAEQGPRRPRADPVSHPLREGGRAAGAGNERDRDGLASHQPAGDERPDRAGGIEIPAHLVDLPRRAVGRDRPGAPQWSSLPNRPALSTGWTAVVQSLAAAARVALPGDHVDVPDAHVGDGRMDGVPPRRPCEDGALALPAARDPDPEAARLRARPVEPPARRPAHLDRAGDTCQRALHDDGRQSRRAPLHDLIRARRRDLDPRLGGGRGSRRRRGGRRRSSRRRSRSADCGGHSSQRQRDDRDQDRTRPQSYVAPESHGSSGGSVATGRRRAVSAGSRHDRGLDGHRRPGAGPTLAEAHGERPHGLVGEDELHRRRAR